MFFKLKLFPKTEEKCLRNRLICKGLKTMYGLHRYKLFLNAHDIVKCKHNLGSFPRYCLFQVLKSNNTCMICIFQADFGILFDVDGVLARGSTPLTAAIEAIRLLEDDQGRLRVPVAFVTNACNRSHDKAAQIQKWLDIQVKRYIS